MVKKQKNILFYFPMYENNFITQLTLIILKSWHGAKTCNT